MTNAQPSAAQLLQQNMGARNMLLQTGVRMVKPMQAATGALGNQIIIPLDRSGILTAVELHVSCTLNITAAMTASPFGPHNLIKNVAYTDFAGVNRSILPGVMLYAMDSIRQNKLFNNPATNLTNAASNLFLNPTAINAAAPMFFILRLPIAYDKMDLTGAVLAQTAVGQHYITINLANTLVNADGWLSPYTAGTATVGNVSVTAYMEYIQPQSLAGLPVLDLSTIYGFEGNYTTSDNLAVGQQKYINYPNMRSVLSALIAYDNGAVFNPGTDITEFDIVANSNVNILQCGPKYLLNKMREGLNGDLPAAMYYFGHRLNPINTTLYGNVQIAINPSSVGANSYVPYMFEVKYPSGQPLPGIGQG